MELQKVDHHLQQAFAHLKEALSVSVTMVLNKQISKDDIGKRWEVFFREFFDMIKTKGKENRLNLLSWISFSKIWRW
jgi:hypothetical protein